MVVVARARLGTCTTVKEKCDFWSIFPLCGMQDLLKDLNTADQVQSVSVSLQHSKNWKRSLTCKLAYVWSKLSGFQPHSIIPITNKSQSKPPHFKVCIYRSPYVLHLKFLSSPNVRLWHRLAKKWKDSKLRTWWVMSCSPPKWCIFQLIVIFFLEDELLPVSSWPFFQNSDDWNN